LNALLALGL